MPVNPYAEFQKPAVADPYAEFQSPTIAPPPAPPVAPSLTMGDRLFGQHPISDTLSVVGSHLRNLVAGPIHAFTDGPQNPQEAQEMGTTPDSGVIARGLGHIGLGAARILVNPTINSGKAAISELKAGIATGAGPGHFTAAANDAMDAVPLAGPWARSIENDAQAHGALPALAGLGTDIAVPKVVGGGITMAAKGAGFGGALASASDATRNLTLTRALVKGTPGELLQSALKPGVKYGAEAGAMLAKSIPDVLAADPNVTGVSGFAKASDAARDAAFEPYKNLTAPYRPLPAGAAGPVRPSAIDGNPIADAQMNSIPAMNRFEDVPTLSPTLKTALPSKGGVPPISYPSLPKGGILADTADTADLYRKALDVPTLDDIRGDANAKLNAFYNKAGGDRAAALSNPETARVKAVGDASRSVLYPSLEKDAGLPTGSVDAMQEKYGRLVDASDIANKREPIFARHDPVSLSQKIVSGHGNPLSAAWNYILQDKLGDLTNSDAQVNSAVDRFKNPVKPPIVPRPGILPQAILPAAQLLRKTPSIPLLANPMFLGKDQR